MPGEQRRIEPHRGGAFLHDAGDLVCAQPAVNTVSPRTPRNTEPAVIFAAASHATSRRRLATA
jgi:hypothetical protein